MAERRNFFTDGAAYERMMGRWSTLAGTSFLDWLGLPRGLQWLDVGCGTGAFSELLAASQDPAAVQGIDPSAAQIAYARTRPGASVAHFREGDAQALPFADDSFDAAVMPLVIAFVPDPAKAVAEMARVVRPGGWIAAYMWDGPGGGSPVEPFNAAMRSLGIAYQPAPNTAASTEIAMRALWEQAGLRSAETRVIPVPISFPGFDDFWETNTVIGPIGQAMQTMSPATKDSLKTHLRGRVPTEPGGRIAYTARANAVKGQVPGG